VFSVTQLDLVIMNLLVQKKRYFQF